MAVSAARGEALAGPGLEPGRKRVVIGGLLLVMLLSALDSTIVSTALPTIVGELGGLERLGWVVTAYLLAQTVVTPIFGKLGDLYGRKRVLQVAIVIFLIGSALCGLSRDMLQLIVFRAVQGVGGGGLLVTTQAAIGDVVSPRERGRYQGLFGAVFGVSSVAGPLLGGFFTTNFTWRWIFYINVPLGLAALVVLAVVMPASPRRAAHSIDYAGAALLAAALSAIVLLTDLGGTTLAWSAPPMLLLAALGAACLAAFVVVERRAAEPVLPLRLFSNRVFTVSSLVGLIVGGSMFGSVTFLPLFLQVVRGASPTASGLQLLPMMGGMLVTSISAGQVISRTGRYRIFPIAGTAVMTVGLLLLSTLRAETSMPLTFLYMLVLGLGLGMVMQVLVLAVQNSVDYADLGVATSGATLFRLIGGSVGTAVFGTIFAARLATEMAAAPLLSGAAGAAASTRMDPATLRALPVPVRDAYVQAFSDSLTTVFLVAAAIAAVGFALSWLLEERPLRETVAESGTGVGEAFAMPVPTDSLAQVSRGLALLDDRATQRRLLERMAARAGLALSPAACWLLARIARDPATEPGALAAQYQLDAGRLAAAIGELEARGLVTPSEPAGGGARLHHLTPPGAAALERLVAAHRDALLDLVDEWAPARHPELRQLVDELSEDVGAEVTA